LPAPSADFISLAGQKFRIKPPEQGRSTYRRIADPAHIERQDIDGRSGAQNLQRKIWLWHLSNFSGGEGRRVFDANSQGEPPHFWKTDGGIDTRISGEFKMSPVTEMVLDNDDVGSTSTEWEGNTLTTDSGSPTTSGSNAVLNAVEGVAKTGRTPGAVTVGISARFLWNIAAGATFTARLRAVETAPGSDVMGTATLSIGAGDDRVGSHQLALGFTGIAGETYKYVAELTAVSGTNSVEVDSINELVGNSPDDVRALALGYEDKPFAYDWDGTNTDIYVWDQANSMWDSVDGDVDNSLPVAATNSDSFQYLLVADRVIFRHTDALAASTTYTTQKANTVAGGIAVAGNRLYQLLFGSARELGELTLDGGGTYTSGDANWNVVATTTDFPNEESADTTLRQRICSIGGGVRFFVNARGGTSQVYEFSEGALRPMRHCVLGGGYTMTAIAHNGGITWVGATYSGSGDDPATDRAALYYIGADEVLHLAVEFRPDDPDENRVSYIVFDQHYVYAQQGNHLWQYDPTRGAHVMDTHFGSAGEAGRGIAVQDTKKFAAYSGEGVQVSQDSYPVDQTVYMYGPLWDFDAPETDKVLVSIDLLMGSLPANTTVKAEYEIDLSGTWTQAGADITTDGTTDATLTVSTSSSTVKFKVMRWRIGLSSSDGASTPTIRAVTTKARVITYNEAFELAVLIDDDSSSSHLPGQQLKGFQKASLLKTIKDNGNLVPYVDRFGIQEPSTPTTYTVALDGLEVDLDSKGEGEANLLLTVV
jgi:hypothetical protein